MEGYDKNSRAPGAARELALWIFAADATVARSMDALVRVRLAQTRRFEDVETLLAALIDMAGPAPDCLLVDDYGIKERVGDILTAAETHVPPIPIVAIHSGLSGGFQSTIESWGPNVHQLEKPYLPEDLLNILDLVAST